MSVSVGIGFRVVSCVIVFGGKLEVTHEPGAKRLDCATVKALAIISPPSKEVRSWNCKTEEEFALKLEEWADKLWDFFDDHEQTRGIDIDIQREIASVCSKCGGKWETEEDEVSGDRYCVHCGAWVDDE